MSFRFLTAGESHGRELTVIVDGVPAGLPLEAGYINEQLARRQAGYGRGGRMAIERDEVRITAGVRGGLTLGSPVSLVIANRDWANWEAVMAPGPEAALDQRVVTRPRPGHADLSGGMKYGHRDLRNVLERSSARETAARVAAGAVARRLLEELGMEILGHVLQIGPVRVERDLTLDQVRQEAPASPVFCADPTAAAGMMRAIDAAREDGDTLGGIFAVLALGLPPGLGSYSQWDRRLDGLLAQAVMSIPAIKGVEIGLGMGVAAVPGSRVHDEIFYSHGGEGAPTGVGPGRCAGTCPARNFHRHTNRAGGLEGGVTNGEPLVVRAAMKPIPTLRRPLWSVDIESKEAVEAAFERSDVCAVPAASVVGEAMVAVVLAAALSEKFGGDSLAEIRQNLAAYRERLDAY
ncbi:MAG: chorismate synthase [Clostridia bacterium]|nr:MAG: chorismate synthase [Clostridia bacterium]